MIQGFLRREGRTIVDGTGKPFLLRGWGLGNWLLTEGYMWCIYHPRFDRPRRIEQVVEELTGQEFSRWFWQEFRDTYITQADIAAMAQLGYNSVRIPFSYRHFLEDGPGLRWKTEGFTLLDRCLDWCEQEGIYAFLDLHGAPGGQTGANIDDCIDDVPRLFIDSDAREKALALWKVLAQRYADRKVVAGYDLLNEPIAPAGGDHASYDYLQPQLISFYQDAIFQIRQVDPRHLISLEGMHWSTNPSIFEVDYDENVVIHFHRYAEPPEIACLRTFLDVSKRKNQPLWLGETGENVNSWYAALYPLCEKLGIGYHLWPWKKMDCTNSPCSIARPKEWNLIADYVAGGPHPGYEKAQDILKEYLHHIRYENCEYHEAVTNHIFRKPPFAMQAVDFDLSESELLASTVPLEQEYRNCSGKEILALWHDYEKKFVFDSGWERFALMVREGEQVCYSFCSAAAQVSITLEYTVAGQTVIEVGCADGHMQEVSLEGNSHTVLCAVEQRKGNACLTIQVQKGSVQMRRICFS